MKKFLKSAGLPIGVFALAIGSAFATNAMSNSSLFATHDAFQKIDSNGLVCIKQDRCQDTGTMLCTWLNPETNQNEQLYGKADVSDPSTVCTKPLYRN